MLEILKHSLVVIEKKRKKEETKHLFFKQISSFLI